MTELMETRRRGQEFIAGLPGSEKKQQKKQRMLAVFDAYTDGKKSGEVTAAAVVSKGSVSGYLNEIEAAVECKIVRGRPEGGSVTAALKSDSSLLRVKREGSERRASVRDFHSFRVTWVTLALTAGVPLELVQKVTGHKTTDIVLKHYFQPGREDFRQALQSAMPRLLTGGGRAETGKAESRNGGGRERSEVRGQRPGSRREQGEGGDARDARHREAGGAARADAQGLGEAVRRGLLNFVEDGTFEPRRHGVRFQLQ